MNPSPPAPVGPSSPTIALVTPSLNQARYLEATLRSVLDQGYPSLEYVVVDGGSTDGSVEVLERYGPRLARWSSVRDRGMYDALNRGFDQTAGEIMGWLNADDLHLPHTLATVAEIFRHFPEVDWLTSLRPKACDAHGRPRWRRRLPGFHAAGFWRGEYVAGVAPFWSGWIPQEATFWRRRLWQRSGGELDARLAHAGDFELWSRFIEHAALVGLDRPLAVFRRQPEQKTAVAWDAYVDEARQVFRTGGGAIPPAAFAWARKVITRLPRPLRAPWRVVGMADQASIIVRRRDAWHRRTVSA